MPVMVGVLASLLVIFLVIGGLIYWKKKQARESSSPSAPMSTVSARVPRETPTAPTPELPPTYDEAIEESKRTTAAVSDTAI